MLFMILTCVALIHYAWVKPFLCGKICGRPFCERLHNLIIEARVIYTVFWICKVRLLVNFLTEISRSFFQVFLLYCLKLFFSIFKMSKYLIISVNIDHFTSFSKDFCYFSVDIICLNRRNGELLWMFVYINLCFFLLLCMASADHVIFACHIFEEEKNKG